MIQWEEMLDFIKLIKGNDGFVPLWKLYADARVKKGWQAEEVRSCIAFLHRSGKIRMDEFGAIYV